MNQDSAATTPRLLVVADGMGGHAHGEVASATAVGALLDLDARLRDTDLGDRDLLSELGGAITDAAGRLTALARQDPDLRGTGTTLIAFLVSDTHIGVAHIGDSRAYRLRNADLDQLTRDHTMVQVMVDEGRISEAEAATHPRRSWLVRTLQEDTAADPDLFLLDARTNDRYLICSDGVTAVLEDDEIADILLAFADPADVVARLIERANESGGPDNITCVVADLVDEPLSTEDTPVVVGAAETAP